MRRPLHVWRGIASLRRRLTLEEPENISDGAGGFETSYKTKATLWACTMCEDSTSMLESMGRKDCKGRYRITIRWRRGITTAHRFRDDHESFKIIGVENPDSRRQFLVCTAEAYTL
jgi:head-tail adaptor